MSPEAPVAIRAYLFGKAYSDIASTLRRAWAINWEEAKASFEAASRPAEGIEKLYPAYHLAEGLVTLGIGGLLALTLSTAHLLVVACLTLLHATIVAATWSTEWAWLRLRAFSVDCPVCHEVTRLPIYTCPSCGRPHPRLEPSLAGAFHHRCRCGQSLSATVFGERAALDSSCPECGSALSADHFLSRKTHVVLVGGPSAGKTTFLYAAVSELMRRWRAEGGTAEFGDGRIPYVFEDAERRIAQGSAPAKSQAHHPPAFHIRFERPGAGFRMLYVHDAAGEIWQDSARLSRHLYFDRLAGVIHLVDPFTQPAVRSAATDELLRSVLPSAMDPLQALQALVVTLTQRVSRQSHGQFPFPFAMVVTKEDALPASLRRTLADDPTAASRAWGLGATLELASTTFDTTAVYPSAALRRTEAGHAPVGVVEPLLWLLERQEPEFWGLRPPPG